MPFPTFKELKDFIISKPGATICEIRDQFSQKGDDCVTQVDGKKKYVVAYHINGAFYLHLVKFIREPYVKVEQNALACLISDNTRYVGPGTFLPIILSITST